MNSENISGEVTRWWCIVGETRGGVSSNGPCTNRRAERHKRVNKEQCSLEGCVMRAMELESKICCMFAELGRIFLVGILFISALFTRPSDNSQGNHSFLPGKVADVVNRTPYIVPPNNAQESRVDAPV